MALTACAVPAAMAQPATVLSSAGPEVAAYIDAALSPVPAHLLDSPPPIEERYLDVFRARLDEVMTRRESVGLAVAVLERGVPVLVYVNGEEEAGSGRPITRDTVFRAASVSKGMTGTLLALLEAQGRVNLSDSVPRELLPLPRGQYASVAEVLSQRTGLRPHALDREMERGENVSELRGRLRSQPTVCRPGDCYSYQNIAFGSVEIIAAQAAGMDFATAMRAHVFERVGMHDASVGVSAMRQSPSWARPHRRRDRDADGMPQAGDPETVYDATAAAASVNVSINDMIAWAQAQLGTSSRLPPAVLARVQTSQGDTPSQTRRLYRLEDRIENTGYGLGFRVYDWSGHRLITHSGYLSGYGAQIYAEPDTGFAYVALWNNDGSAPWWLFPTLMDLRTGDGPGDWLDLLDED
tara:strand:+ start:7613 stop:8842 length:1230 start_codon:yes stop_codon:yes gene_type:complete